jgi:AraC-like DNA-binding protein
MAVVLDTADMAREVRAEAVAAAMLRAGVPALLTHEAPDGEVHARVELWELGAGASLMRRRSSGIRLSRTSKQIRMGGPESVALSVLSPGPWSYTQQGRTRSAATGGAEMVITDHSATYDFRRVDAGTTHAVNIDHAMLGLPAEVIRRAVRQFEPSPLSALVAAHIERVVDCIDDLAAAGATTMIGSATAELVRALIVTAAQDGTRQREAMADSLLVRLTLYLHKHVTDPELTPARIARVHNISVRHLYNIWTHPRLSLAEWIMTERLEMSRRELAKPGAQSQTIAVIARRCGFADTTHFARRFRNAYAMSPREWRTLARAVPESADGDGVDGRSPNTKRGDG